MAVWIGQKRLSKEPLDQVEWVGNVRSKLGWDMARIIRESGMSANWVEERLSIFRASPMVRDSLGEGIIRVGHAVLLGNIDGWEEQEEMLHQQIARGWTVRRLKEEIDCGSREKTRSGIDALERPTRSRAGKAGQCSGCGVEEDETAQIQTVTVCGRCLHALKRMGLDPPEERGMAGLVALLGDARDILAGFQAGAMMADRIDRVLEELSPPAKHTEDKIVSAG